MKYIWYNEKLMKREQMELKINKKKIAKICRKYDIKLLVLHGSHVSGHAISTSDVDIGILGKKKFNADQYLDILNDFGEIFGDKFDPVFLNGAEPMISYHVAMNGEPLYEEANGIFASFRVQSIARYMDSKKFRDLEKIYIKRAIGKV
jgi:predicted nucleotidyltransferase